MRFLCSDVTLLSPLLRGSRLFPGQRVVRSPWPVDGRQSASWLCAARSTHTAPRLLC